MDRTALTALLNRDISNKGYAHPVRAEVRDSLIVFFVLVSDGTKTHRREFTIETPSDLVCMPGVFTVQNKAACLAYQMAHQGLEVV